jgi:hypothetical protein
MHKEYIAVENFIVLLGCSRSDAEVVRLIDEVGRQAAHTIDKEDGADDEYVEARSRGFCLYFDAGRLTSIFLYSEKKDPSYCRYALPLPLGISFGQSKPDVLLSLGKPSTEGGGKKDFFGYVPKWIRYDKGAYSVHVEFSGEADIVQMVTLMPSGMYR